MSRFSLEKSFRKSLFIFFGDGGRPEMKLEMRISVGNYMGPAKLDQKIILHLIESILELVLSENLESKVGLT